MNKDDKESRDLVKQIFSEYKNDCNEMKILHYEINIRTLVSAYITAKNALEKYRDNDLSLALRGIDHNVQLELLTKEHAFLTKEYKFLEQECNNLYSSNQELRRKLRKIENILNERH